MYFTKLDSNAVIPTRGTLSSAGFDFTLLENVTCLPGVPTKMRTGVGVLLPRDTYGRLALRSGFSLKYPLVASAGVIDVDYSGEIMFIVVNCSVTPVDIVAGTKFGQMVVERVYMGPSTEITNEYFMTNCGSHIGWGSTG